MDFEVLGALKCVFVTKQTLLYESNKISDIMSIFDISHQVMKLLFVANHSKEQAILIHFVTIERHCF
jgi:hypothetical protein